MEKQFSDISYEITKLLSNDEKKDGGIYFTPMNTIKRLTPILEPRLKKISRVLEPSCGSCEFIKYLDPILPKSSKIDGIEFNTKIYEKIKTMEFKHKISLKNLDFLKFETNDKYDLIIGNPPYFVISKSDIDKKYLKLFDGRPNIYIIFIIKCLELLSQNGLLAFVLPKNFLNCIYYNKLREHIYKNYKIVDIIDCSDDTYIDTAQDTILLVIENTDGDNDKYCLNINNTFMYNTLDNVEKINELYDGSTTLNEMGFDVKVGSVVWNQVKDKLTANNTKTRLIYSSDIVDNKLSMKEYKNNEKKNYIEKDGWDTKLLVVNRGYGKGEYNFNYCLINPVECGKYLIENHLIYIKYRGEIIDKKLDKLYKRVIDSFKNKKTVEFIKLYFGNNAINTTELQYILPIY